MSIQGSINQLLSTAAVAVKLSPIGEKTAAKVAEEKEWKKLSEKEKAVTEGIAAKRNVIFGKPSEPKEPLTDEQVAVAAEELDKSQAELLRIAEEQFERRPSEQSYKKVQQEKDWSKTTGNLVKEFRGKVEKEAAKKEAAKEKSKIARQQKAQKKAEESLAARQFEINILKGTPSEYRLYKGDNK